MISRYIIQSYSIKVIQMKIRMKIISENKPLQVNDLEDRLPANKNFPRPKPTSQTIVLYSTLSSTFLRSRFYCNIYWKANKSLNLFWIEIWAFKFITLYHTRDSLGVITAIYITFLRKFKCNIWLLSKIPWVLLLWSELFISFWLRPLFVGSDSFFLV